MPEVADIIRADLLHVATNYAGTTCGGKKKISLVDLCPHTMTH
jgi:hypothetical protein